MRLILLEETFSVCRLSTAQGLDLARPGTSLTVLRDEISYVCPSALAPPHAEKAEHGWRALQVDGVLEFGMVGVLAALSGLLARAGVSIFVLSTYNTDVLLVKAVQLDCALAALRGAGYQVDKV